MRRKVASPPTLCLVWDQQTLHFSGDPPTRPTCLCFSNPPTLLFSWDPLADCTGSAPSFFAGESADLACALGGASADLAYAQGSAPDPALDSDDLTTLANPQTLRIGVDPQPLRFRRPSVLHWGEAFRRHCMHFGFR